MEVASGKSWANGQSNPPPVQSWDSVWSPVSGRSRKNLSELTRGVAQCLLAFDASLVELCEALLFAGGPSWTTESLQGSLDSVASSDTLAPVEKGNF